MATKSPVQIGTKGTVGSLIMQEIKFYSQSEASCSRDFVRETNTKLVVIPRKKKKRGGSKFLSNMCSMVEVSDCRRLNSAVGLNYKNLKTDGLQFKSSAT